MNICLYFGVAPTVEDEGRLKNIFLQKYQIQTTILITESVEFSDSPFRTNFAESSLEVAFLLHVGSPVQNSEFHFRSELRERERERERTFAVGVFEKGNPERYL